MLTSPYWGTNTSKKVTMDRLRLLCLDVVLLVIFKT
jgi:hypothetical protein